MRDPAARERILEAAAKLISEAGGEPVSTRAVLTEAGVGAPTLYHHFGDKRGLFDAVVAHGFARYVAEVRARPEAADPLQEVRRVWDAHVAFGLAHPAFYGLMYGSPRPGERPAGADTADALLLSPLRAAARAGLLAVPPEEAAPMVAAATVGVTLAMISGADTALSAHTRDALLAGIGRRAGDGAAPAPGATPLTGLAIALGAALDEEGRGVLTAGERGLLREWLNRLAG